MLAIALVLTGIGGDGTGAAAIARGAAGSLAALLTVVPLAYLMIFGHAVLLALGIRTPEPIVLFAAPIVLPVVGGAPLAVAESD